MQFFKNLFGLKLAEHIPGERRVYKNIFGKAIKTIERSETTINNLEVEKISKFIDDLDKVGIKRDALDAMDKITATRKPINTVSFFVADKNGYIQRANVSLNSGEAKMRYRSSFFNGELDSIEADVK